MSLKFAVIVLLFLNMFIDKWGPLVAILIKTEAQEEVRCCGIKMQQKGRGKKS